MAIYMIMLISEKLISATDWKGLLCDNVDDSVQRWQECFIEIMRDCIPTKPLPKHRHPPWLSGSIIFIRKRMHNFRKQKDPIQSNFTPCAISLFKKQNY